MSKISLMVQIDDDIKKEAAIVLAEHGLTISEYIEILLTKIAKEKTIPVDTIITYIYYTEPLKGNCIDDYGNIWRCKTTGTSED